MLGANHLGLTMKPRVQNALQFLGRALRPVEKDIELEEKWILIQKVCPIPEPADPGYVDRRVRELSNAQKSQQEEQQQQDGASKQ